MKLVYLSTLDLPPILNLNTPFPLYLSTPLTLARLCLQNTLLLRRPKCCLA